LIEQQNSENPEQQVEPQPHEALPQVHTAPYAVPGWSRSSTPEPTATALPTIAERLMKLRRDNRDARNVEARFTSAVLTRPTRA
jgi:hypothetical protein